MPNSPGELTALLEPFYFEQRMASQKIERLRRFLASSLAQRLWTMSAAEAAKQIGLLWGEIADVMGQTPKAKTISFSAKMLALALSLLGERGLEFGGIPVPVDLRLQKLTPALDEETIRQFWDAVLVRLRRVDDRLTHIHLDSFLWQYAGTDDQQAYLRQIGVSKLSAQQINEALRTLRAWAA